MSSEAAGGLHVMETLRRSDIEGTGESAERLLRDLGMPPEEIRAVLVADDPRLVRRHLELHRERLSEELEDRRRALSAIECDLADAALERASVQPGEDGGSSTEPSSWIVQNGLWATSHGWPSGSTKTPE
jgi:hypothetical protein